MNSVEEQKHDLSQGAWILVCSIIFGYTADYGFNLTLSQHLEAHQYGDYKVAYSLTMLASVLVLLGGDRLAPRILSKYIADNDNSAVSSYLACYIKRAFALSVVIIALVWFLSYLHVIHFDADGHHALSLMIVAVPIIALSALLSRVLQSANLLAFSNLSWRVVLPLLKTCAVLVLAQLFISVNVELVIVAGIMVVISIVVWQMWLLFKKNIVTLTPIESYTPDNELLKLSIPMMLAMLVTLLLNQSDLLMLEWLSNEHGVGHFAAANTLAHIIPVAQVTIASLFLPLIGKYLDKEPNTAEKLFKQAKTITLIVTVLVAVLLWTFSTQLLTLFGSDYIDASTALLILIPSYGICALAALTATWLQYTGQGKQVVQFGVLALLVNLLANALLIPQFALTGAAMATAVSLSIWSIAVFMQYHFADQKHLAAVRE
jgi:O-antigen/teichoic acid export membrane protein